MVARLRTWSDFTGRHREQFATGARAWRFTNPLELKSAPRCERARDPHVEQRINLITLGVSDLGRARSLTSRSPSRTCRKCWTQSRAWVAG